MLEAAERPSSHVTAAAERPSKPVTAAADALPSPMTRDLKLRVFLFAAAVASAGLPLYIHMPRFAAEQLEISLAAVGTLLLALRAVDFLQDPAFGWIAERRPAARGLLVGAGVVAMAAGYLGLYALPPKLPPLLWVMLAALLLLSGFSLLSILFYGQSVAIAGGVDGLARLAAWREAGTVSGVLLAAVLPELLSATLSPGVAYPAYGGVLAGLVLLAGILSKPLWRRPGAPATGFRWRTFRQSQAAGLLGLAFLNALPVAVTATLFLFFVEDRLRLAGWSGPLLALFFLSAALAAPAWGQAMQRFGPKRSLQLGMAMAVASFAWALLLPEEALLAFTVICVLSGIAVGADLVILPAWFAARLGRAGMSADAGFGLWSASGKMALGFGALLTLPALEWASFRAGADNDPQALMTLSLLYAGLPCLLKLIALAVLMRSPDPETPA